MNSFTKAVKSASANNMMGIIKNAWFLIVKLKYLQSELFKNKRFLFCPLLNHISVVLKRNYFNDGYHNSVTLFSKFSKCDF